MVYVGPSTGCYLCRKRKIKCSEERPGCRNCSVYGAPCPGYRPETASRSQPQKARRRTSSTKKHHNSSSQKTSSTSSECKPSQPASDGADDLASVTESSGSTSNATSAATDSTDGSRHLALSLYRASDSTWDERAVCFFFDQYTTVSESGDCVSHLQCLPGLYARCQEQSGRDAPSSCLQWAVNATALMSLGQESQAPALTHRARKNYGVAIRELRQQLMSPGQAIKDEIFAAVVMLALFEDISGERNGLSSSHTAGMELLMKLRGQSQLCHPQGRDLFAYAYAQTHIEILALGDRPRFSNDWIIKALCGTDPVQRMIVISSKISQLFLQVSSMQPEVKAPDAAPDWVQSQVTSWVDAAQVLDRELVEWPRQLPEQWLPLHVYGQNGEPALLTYQRVSYTSIWNYYRAVRIVMQRMLTELRGTVGILALAGGIPRSGSSSKNTKTNININDYLLDEFSSSSAHDIIQQMISDICRSLPFALGDIDAHGKRTSSCSSSSFYSSFPSSSCSSTSPTSSSHVSSPEKPKIKAIHGYSLLWPLWYVLSCGMATPQQVSQVRAALARLGSASGIKLALVLANGLPEMKVETTARAATAAAATVPFIPPVIQPL